MESPMDAQTRQILEWSGEPEKAKADFSQFLLGYQEKTGRSFDLESVNAKRLLTLFGNSHFLTRFLIQHPGEADALVTSLYIETDKSLKNYKNEIHQMTRSFSHSEEFEKKILFYKYREFLRLTIKDLSQSTSLPSLLQEISDLAIAILQAGLDFITLQQKPLPCGFAVIAMGKLGGGELNYSSDVDLQYIYDFDSAETKDQNSPGHHEYFVRLSENFSRLLSQKTSSGFLYRVDLNLRPEGKSGALANSLAALEHYYETFGQEWERQALIKATPIAGDPRLGKKFKQLIEPFVWRKSFDAASLEKIKEIKKNLHQSVTPSSTRGFHVKLGRGGIREIEFFVQILQLLYGGSHPELRSPQTLTTLDALAKLKMIQEQDAQKLKDAYLFLRRLEHRLQMLHETQTHELPLKSPAQQALARRMGYFEENPEEARNRFLDDLARHQVIVQNITQNLFEKTR